MKPYSAAEALTRYKTIIQYARAYVDSYRVYPPIDKRDHLELLEGLARCHKEAFALYNLYKQAAEKEAHHG